MGFNAFHSASATLEGIETAHTIRKGQIGSKGHSVFQVMAELAVYAKAEIIKGSPLGKELEKMYIRRAKGRKTVTDPEARIDVLRRELS